MRADRLDRVYTSLANTHAVRALVLENGPLHGDYRVAAGVTSGLLPSLIIEGRASSPARARLIAARVSLALRTYIKQWQTAAGIPESKRVHLTVVSAAGEPERIRGRWRKLPLFALGGVMALLLLAARIRSDGRPWRASTQVEPDARVFLRPQTSRTTMREYELEVNEDDGRVTTATISSDDWFTVGDVFEDEGRALRVWRIEQADPPCVARLICDPYVWETLVAEPEAPSARRRRARHLPTDAEQSTGTEEPLAEAEEPEAAETEERPFTIEVSPEAAERIRGKGGTLYLWERPVGAWLEDKAGFARPDTVAVEFDEFDIDGIHILIASDIELAEHLTIEHSRFSPRLKLHILWDGQPWGRRGSVASDPSGH
jgi:hypothetical protein